MSKIIINDPHALYYNGELIGIITNADPYADLGTICDMLSPDEGAADIRSINAEALRAALAPLGIADVIEPPKPPEGSVWEDFHDDLCGLIGPMGDPFYVYVDRDRMAVVIIDHDGDELTHKIPLTH